MPDPSTRSPELEAFFRYRDRVTSDPLRLHILVAHVLIEELIELLIIEAVPHPECLDARKMQFWRKLDLIRALELPPENDKLWTFIEKLTELRNAAAHKNYEEKRDRQFRELAKLFKPEWPLASVDQYETLLNDSTEICAGVLMGMLDRFRHLRQQHTPSNSGG